VAEKAKTAFEKFRLLTKRLVAVPKTETDKAKLKAQRNRS